MRNGGDIGEFKPHASDIDSNTDSLSKLMLQTRERGLDFIYRGETETGEYICFSHKGLVREKNEDALGGNFKDLFVVADGMEIGRAHV